MATIVADHPCREELEAYGQGRLALDATQALEKHLAECSTCCELLDKTPSDGFLSRLREADSAAPAEPDRDTASSAVGAVTSAVPPELIDHPRYRVLGLVGQGGMGAVYKAEHRRMERTVALKVIHPSLMRQPVAVQRFHQEVRAAARLHHANIVTAHDADQAGGLHFLVMEYVEGTSLAELVRQRGPLPVAEACAYARQVARGLQHAHEQGMVHRDIKPANLMIADCGSRIADSGQSTIRNPQSAIAKILDFGLARLPRTSDAPSMGNAATGPLTGAGMVMGTADYIAPEQAADPRSADIRADIYALGCTLFFLLTGRPPFPDGTVLDKLAWHAGTPLPALNELCPDIPAGLADVLACMTAKDPVKRYATPAAVAEALAPFCPVAESRPLPVRKRRRWLAAALVLLAAATLTGVTMWHFHGDTAKQTLDKGPGQVVRNLGAAPAPMTEDQAAEVLRKLGGEVSRNGQGPGKPFLSVKLAGTKVTDDDLRAIPAFRQLQFLDLTRTAVTNAGMTHLTGLTQLSTLLLAGTKVTDVGLQSVGGLQQLELLDLQSTPVGDAGMQSLIGLANLHLLFLYETKVTDAGMLDVGRLKTLTYLSLDRTAISDVGLQRLAGLTELNHLSLAGVRGVGNEGMKTVALFKGLRFLDVRDSRATDQGLKELAGLTKLSVLQLGGLRVTDTGVQALAGLAELDRLDLSRTDISDDGLKQVARHRSLTNLSLQSAKNVTDAGIKQLAGLPDLKVLDLAWTDITDAALKELAKCPNLLFIGLGGASKVTDAAIAELQKARPNLKILR